MIRRPPRSPLFPKPAALPTSARRTRPRTRSSCPQAATASRRPGQRQGLPSRHRRSRTNAASLSAPPATQTTPEPAAPPREWRESNCAADRKPGSTPWVTPCWRPASLRQAYGPDGRANCPGDVVTVSGDSDDAALLFGDRRGGAMLAPQSPQVKHAPVGRQQERAGDREAPGIGPLRLAHSHDTAEIVDVVGAAGPSPKGPEIDDAGPLRPQKRVAASAHDLPSGVDSQRDAGSCSQGTEIPHAIGRRPEEIGRAHV